MLSQTFATCTLLGSTPRLNGGPRFRQRDWQQAATALQRAVQLDAQLTEAYYPLGQTLRKLGRDERPTVE